jgi:EmrB/QacA subfamily drug resistance transporter
MSERAEAEGGPGGISAGERRLVTAAMMLAMSVAALEQTVVATAMPRIMAALGGGEIYAWVFSAYLLAATVTTPIYGKLADLWGRKRLLLFGLGLFLLGSVLSGLSTSMPMLIGMRVIQGLGAGALMPIVLTIIGDIFTLQERAKVQGWFSAVWGGASVAGPILGGWLTDQFSWRYVFFVSVPFGLVAAAVVVRYFHESLKPREVKPIDWQGAILLASGATLLLLAVLEGTKAPAAVVGALWVGSIGLLTSFFAWEARAADPILPPDLLRTPIILASISGSFLLGTLMFGLDTFVPLYFQGVLLKSATEAGGLLTPLFLSWSFSVAVAARLVVRYGFRAGAVAGTVLIVVGSTAIGVGASMPELAPTYFAAGMVLIGLGMGPASLSYILTVQNAVPWGRRGVATGAVTFTRSLGGALGVALLGGTLLFDLGRRMPGASDLTAAMRAESLQRLGAERMAEIRAALELALRDLFFVIVGVGALGLWFAWRLPAGRAVGAHPAPKPEGEPAVEPAAAFVE